MEQLTEDKDYYLETIPTTQIMQFQNSITFFYKSYISELPDNTTPEYPRWFKPFVEKYLSEKESHILKSILPKALDKDTLQIEAGSTIKHSSSVIDIFDNLTALYDSINKLECPLPDLNDTYHKRFCETIDRVLTEYTKRLVGVFNEGQGVLSKSCVVLCNIHQVRDELQSLYKTMGSDRLDIDARKILDDTQRFLRVERNTLIMEVIESMKVHIQKCIRDIKAELRNVKSSAKKDNCMDIVAPLIEYLDNVFAILVNNTYEALRKPLVRQIWKQTLKLFEKIIILPSDTITQKGDDIHELDSKQSQVLEDMLNGLKLYFVDNTGNIVKQKTLQNMSEMKELKGVLAQYRKTTDTLIKEFVNQAHQQNNLAEVDSQGELHVQLDLFTHTVQEHWDCIVKGMILNLKYSSALLQYNFLSTMTKHYLCNLIIKMKSLNSRLLIKWDVGAQFSEIVISCFESKTSH